MVVVQAPRRFRLGLASLDQFVESRCRLRDRAFADRVGVGGLDRQTAELIRVRTQCLRQLRAAVRRQPRLRLVHNSHNGLRTLDGGRRGCSFLDAAATQGNEAVHRVEAVLRLGGRATQHFEQRVPSVRRLVVGGRRDLHDRRAPRRPRHTDRLPLSIPPVTQNGGHRFGAADRRDKRALAPPTRTRQHRALLDATARVRVQLVQPR